MLDRNGLRPARYIVTREGALGKSSPLKLDLSGKETPRKQRDVPRSRRGSDEGEGLRANRFVLEVDIQVSPANSAIRRIRRPADNCRRSCRNVHTECCAKKRDTGNRPRRCVPGSQKFNFFRSRGRAALSVCCELRG
jgi:hypothetical protein